MTSRIPLLLAATITCVASVPIHAQAPTDEAVIAEVQATANALMSADSARSVERIVDLYASDAVMLPPGESPVVGIEAIRPRYEAFFKTHQPGLYFLIDETVVVDDLAYVRGRTRGSIRNLESGGEIVINDTFLMILRRSEEETWHISRLMWHDAGEAG